MVLFACSVALCRFGSSRQFRRNLSEISRVFFFGSSLPRRSHTHLVESMDLSFHGFSGFPFEQHPHPFRVSFPDRFLHGVHRRLDLRRDASRARLHAWKAHHTRTCGHRPRPRRLCRTVFAAPLASPHPNARLIRSDPFCEEEQGGRDPTRSERVDPGSLGFDRWCETGSKRKRPNETEGRHPRRIRSKRREMQGRGRERSSVGRGTRGGRSGNDECEGEGGDRVEW